MKKFIVAIAAVAMLTGSAYAADWNFYGSARVSTFYNDTEEINTPNTDTTNYAQALQSNARIGAKVKVSDELSGRFEYGAASGNANIRLLYGEWNFGAGKFLVGQDYTPLYLPGSGQVYAVDNGLGGWGEVYGSRKAQLKLTFGGFQVAVLAPSTNHTLTEVAAATAIATDKTEATIPQIQAAYTFKGSNWDVTLAGGYQTFEVAADANMDAAQDVTSYVLAATANMAVGAFKFGASVHGGENTGNMISVDVNGFQDGDNGNNGLARYDAGANKVTDNETFGYRVYAAYTVNDMFGLELGYGQNSAEYDRAASEDDEVTAYYLSAPITLAPGVFVIPELGVVDYEEDGQEETTYFGAKWQINF